jgi:hypothetical protein
MTITKLELDLEQEWKVWTIDISFNYIKVYLFLRPRSLNYYIPFKYLNKNVILPKMIYYD